MNIWVTGAEGFIGKYLIKVLADDGNTVIATWYEEENAETIPKHENIKVLKCDVRNRKTVEKLVGKYAPEYIYHLAAQSFPTKSWEDPWYTMETNVIGTVNIFEAVKALKHDAKVFVACSSAEYGYVEPEEIPVKENHLLQPLHPYGVSKVAQDLLAYQYYKNFGIRCTRGRIFNTTGPGKTNDAPNDFATQIVEIEKGKRENKIFVGNLQTERDFTDVRDMVKAIVISTVKGKDGECYNLCSSRPIKIQNVLDTLIGLSTSKIEVVVDEKKLRPSDEKIILGDNAKLTADTGWKPEIPMYKTLADILNYWREKIR
ncbi:MAG: SDR family NAD(P)-dependent oxidoreductase [Thermoplasmata archaeon]